MQPKNEIEQEGVNIFYEDNEEEPSSMNEITNNSNSNNNNANNTDSDNIEIPTQNEETDDENILSSSPTIPTIEEFNRLEIENTPPEPTPSYTSNNNVKFREVKWASLSIPLNLFIFLLLIYFLNLFIFVFYFTFL